MTDSSEGSRRAQTNKQLRGSELQVRVEEVVRGLAEKAKKSGMQYIYNASEVARLVPTTRRSLAKHGEHIAHILQDLDARRRMATGSATAEHLRDQIAYLREQIADRDKRISALSAHHIEIYKRFHAHSLEADLLIRPILERQSEEAGVCILCKRATGVEGMSKQKSNVVPLESRKSSRTPKPDAS